MKRLALALTVFLSLFVFTGCSLFTPDEKEFSGSGITITLNESFTETETVQWPFYLSSLKHIFMGLRESKSTINSYGIYTLNDYIDAVLENGGHPSATVYESENGEYMYAYYSATVEKVKYGYMLICMKGAQHYYVMNFGCLYDELADNKDQYIEWANTIIVT